MDSVKTALRVLEIVGKSDGIGVTDLARQLGEPKSTIQRSLTTLHEDGWIRPAETLGRRRWAVAMKVLSLAQTLEPIALLRDRALSIMEELRDESQETIHLMVREFDHVVFIDRLDSPLPLRTGRDRGDRAPLHVSSAGKTILANLPEAELADYLKRGLSSWTANTITDPDALRAEIALTRRRGYGFANGEFTIEVRAVAAAIVSSPGRPIGALSISCPATRLGDDRVPVLGQLVAQAARRISEQLPQIGVH